MKIACLILFLTIIFCTTFCGNAYSPSPYHLEFRRVSNAQTNNFKNHHQVNFGNNSYLKISMPSHNNHSRVSAKSSIPSTYSIPNSILRTSSEQDFMEALPVLREVIGNQNVFEFFDLYQFNPFYQCIKSLPGYEQFILNLAQRFAHDKKFARRNRRIPGYGKYKFQEYIQGEAAKIVQHQNQVNQIHTNFSQTTDVKKLHNKLASCDSEYKIPSWAVGHQKRDEKRVKALEKINAGGVSWSTKKYTVPESLQLLENDFGLPIFSLKEFYGNQFQHVVHDEFINILKKSESYYRSNKLHVFDKEFTKTVVHFAGVGVEHNTRGYADMAMKISDFCNSALEYIDAFSDGLVDTAITKVINIASDPVGYCKDMVVGAVIVSGYLLKVVHQYLHQSILSYVNPDAAFQSYLDNVEHMTKLLEVAQVYYQNYSGPHIVQKSTALLTDVGLDFYLGGKIIHALSNFCKVGVVQRSEAGSFFTRIFPQKSCAIETAEGYRLLLSAEEASSYIEQWARLF